MEFIFMVAAHFGQLPEWLRKLRRMVQINNADNLFDSTMRRILPLQFPIKHCHLSRRTMQFR